MPFELSLADKNRVTEFPLDGKWHTLGVIGNDGVFRKYHPIEQGEHIVSAHLLGRVLSGLRPDTIWARFIRFPTMDDTAWCPFPIGKRDGTWAVVLTTPLDIGEGVTHLGVQVMSEGPGRRLSLKNRIVKFARTLGL